MKHVKKDYTLEELKEKEEISVRAINCCAYADIYTVNQLVTFYNNFGAFWVIPNCGLISHYKLLSICLKYIQPNDFIELDDKEFKKVLKIFPDLLDSFTYDQTGDIEAAPMRNDIRIMRRGHKTIAAKPNQNEETIRIWTSPLCFWSSAALPGFKYSEKKKAWWKHR
ncbi:MAG: hypothetical protein KG029_02305 [Bacteroidetes bacterium]|nr:hypothetical protein [Bacteroidota bacterium]